MRNIQLPSVQLHSVQCIVYRVYCGLCTFLEWPVHSVHSIMSAVYIYFEQAVECICSKPSWGLGVLPFREMRQGQG